jgi:hypothetical protein
VKRILVTLADIADFDNLARSAYRAARGKRTRQDVRRFFARFDDNINRLARDICDARTP